MGLRSGRPGRDRQSGSEHQELDHVLSDNRAARLLPGFAKKCACWPAPLGLPPK